MALPSRRSIDAARVGVIAIFLVLTAASARTQSTGVLLFTDTEQIPLKAYAEFMRARWK